MGIGQAVRNFGETINLGVNAATGGLFNRGIGYLMGASGDQVDAMNQRFHADTGTAGNLASGIGTVYGLGKLGGVARGVTSAARAAPVAARLVPTAGLGTAARYLAGRAGPGLVPVVATAARPTLGTVAKVAGGAGIIGLNLADGMSSKTNAPAPAAGGDYTAAWKDDPNHIDLRNPVESAMAAGRAATSPITPQERQLQLLDTILKSPNATLSDLKDVTAMLPAPPRPRTAKDTAFGQTAELSRQIFESQIASIAAQKDAGEITEEQARAMTQEAMTGEFQRQAGMQGFNPMNLMQAQLMAPDEEN